MKEHLYSIGMKDKRTGEKTHIRIWAKTVDEATHKVCGILFGVNCAYEWTGSAPLYENNEVISRPVDSEGR